ncbi:MAG: hypothetical protein JSS02_07885, partial [Planctomycetes bacterium]|nr:hypothetical protein [Planctomycetota bacterium]
ELTQRVNQRWADTVRPPWAAERRRRLGLRHRLSQLQSLAGTRPQDVSLHWELACLVKILEGRAALPPYLEKLLERQPPHRPAAFEWALLKVTRGNEQGAAMLESLVDQQRDSYYEPACQALRAYYQLTGHFEEMRDMEARLDGRDAWTDWMREGHRRLSSRMPCLPHGLTEGELAPVRQVIGEEPLLQGAWLALAGNQPAGSPRLFLLCISTSAEPKLFRDRGAESRSARRLVGKISLPGRVIIIVPQGSDRALARRVMALPGSQIELHRGSPAD